MSTDYGFLCRECGTSAIVDNLRYGSLGVLRALYESRALLDQLLAHPDLNEYIEFSSGYLYGLKDAARFAITHSKLGHTVVIGDEYGREHDQCHEYVVCPTCKHREPCMRQEKHEGEHSRERKAP